MSNHDILYELWEESNQPGNSVAIGQIADFTKRNFEKFHSGTGNQISGSDMNYTVLKFILDYCDPIEWKEGLWAAFQRSTDSGSGSYQIWKIYRSLPVNVIGSKRSSLSSNEGARRPDLEEESTATIRRSLSSRSKASAMWELVRNDAVIKTHWQMANFVTRMLGMNDHGETHAKIAASSALTMLDLLAEAGMKPDIVTAGFGDEDDAALVILVATLFHDFGNMVHRVNHPDLSIVLATPVLNRILPTVYPDPVKMTLIKSFILSAIYTHHGEPKPLTIEAALVCIGDSTDMTRGRGRAAFESGSITIHSVSSLAIERVEIRKGKEKPIELRVSMSNSAGIYQVQEILAPKVRAGPLTDYVEIIAVTDGNEGQDEHRIVGGIRMEGSKFVPCTADGVVIREKINS